MRIVFTLFIILLLFFNKGSIDFEYSVERNTSIETLDSPPEFFVLKWEKGTKLFAQKTDLYIEVDSIGRQEVLVLVNENKTPVLYTSEIATPVCADGECKLMHIKFYWTLLGEYAGFDRNIELPLTKYDHDEFQQSDYQKLHELLLDDKSVIGRRSLDQLVDKPKMRSVNGVDAISGATVARVKEAVVSGALYSCYTAWHMVYGDIQEKLKNTTLAALNESMIMEMLYSRNQEYQIFALQKIDDSKYEEHSKQIAEILKSSTPLVRSIIVKSFIQKLKKEPELQRPFWNAFDKIDIGTRSMLLKQLSEAPSFSIEILSKKLDKMSKNQLKLFLDNLAQKESIEPEIRNILNSFVNLKNNPNTYLVTNFLEDREP
ncbi:hypothetical protein [Aurantibacter sp.]|uniref:hypothetical protein n=1 Tax=Aurantibacter sp. TaxID=2807103 RepID=UPI0032661698